MGDWIKVSGSGSGPLAGGNSGKVRLVTGEDEY